MRRLALLGISGSLLVGSLVYFAGPGPAPAELSEATASREESSGKILRSSRRASQVSAPPALSPLGPENEEALRRCLGRSFPSPEAFRAYWREQAADPRAKIQWRVVESEENGRPIRLRLALADGEAEPARLVITLFSVDEEGLPDRLPARPGQENAEAWLAAYLREHPVQRDASLREVPLPGGGTLSLGLDNGAPTLIEWEQAGQRLECAGHPQPLSCRCR